MTYEEWEPTVPDAITRDPLWKMRVYRISLFASDLCWHDVTCLMRDRRTLSVADQLYRACGSTSANIAEGYSRGTGKDRARFYEYALGSAREARDWYFKGRHVLGEAVALHRMNLMSEIIRLLMTIVPSERNSYIREASAGHGDESYYEATASPEDALQALLQNVPLPDTR